MQPSVPACTSRTPLHSCTETGLTPGSSQAPEAEHLLGPFTGLVVCVSGGTPAAKVEVVKAVKAHGASQSGELNKNCTHLVICSGGPRTESAKEK